MTVHHSEGSAFMDVEVSGIYFSVPIDTPLPLSPEVQAQLEEQAARQKAAWDVQDKQSADRMAALNRPARRDADGGLLSPGMLPGDEPIEFATEDMEAGTSNPESFWGDPTDGTGGADPVDPAIRALERGEPWKAPGAIEDVTDQQTGWRP